MNKKKSVISIEENTTICHLHAWEMVQMEALSVPLTVQW